jgi:chromosome transmission fidelity protein 1
LTNVLFQANVCNMVPGGVICFFPSYDYEAFVYSHFEKNGIIEKLNAKKKVFREPKKTGQMDQVLFTRCFHAITKAYAKQ